MALQSLLARLPRKGLLGSKSPLLLLLPPWRMSHTKDVKNLPSFAPDQHLQTDNSQRDYLHPPPETLTFVHLNIQGDDLIRLWERMAARRVRGCLVCLAFSLDGETFAELPGTMIRSDGIIATSASCLSSLESKGLKVTVDVRISDTGEKYNGVLLDAAGFCSDIAFVKISSCGQQPIPAFGTSDCLRFRFYAVAAGCSSPYRGCVSAEPRYVGCHLGPCAGRRTSGTIIEAELANISEPARIGECLVDPYTGVAGIIHYVHDYEVKATPIELVFHTLEHIEMHRSTQESDFRG